MLDPPVAELCDERAAQWSGGIHGSARADELAQPCDRAGGEDLCSVRGAPQAVQPVCDLGGWAGSEDGSVDRPDAGADDEVRSHAGLEERAEHTHLNGAEHSPTAEDDGGPEPTGCHRAMLPPAVLLTASLTFGQAVCCVSAGAADGRGLSRCGTRPVETGDSPPPRRSRGPPKVLDSPYRSARLAP